MNKRIILGILIVISILSITNVSGEQIESLTISFPDFMDVNITETIKVAAKVNATTYTNDTDMYNITMTLEEDGTKTNYSFTPIGPKWWSLSITSDEEENLNFTVYVRNVSSNEVYKSGIDTLRFRIPFYLTLYFYEEGNGTILTQDTGQYSTYCNEFQLVYMEPDASNTTGLDNWGAFDMFKDMNYLDEWFGWVPFYNPVFPARSIDYTQVMWDWYDNCHAKIKLYEANNYSINLVSYEWFTGTETWSYEFIKPQYEDHRTRFESVVVPMMEVANETNQTYHIFASAWDIDKHSVTMNIAKYVMLVSIWIGGIIMIGCVNIKIAGIFAMGFWPMVKFFGWLL